MARSTITVTVTRNLSNVQIQNEAFVVWKALARKILQEHIRPHTPFDEGDLRASLWQRTTKIPYGVRAFFSANVPYAELFELDQAWINSITLHTPGTRAPYIFPGIMDGMDLIEEAIKEICA